MKKLFLGITLLGLSSFFANAKDNGFIIYVTWCGVKVQTVGEDYFSNPEDAKSYYRDLNIIECGSADNPNPEEDPEQPEQP